MILGLGRGKNEDSGGLVRREMHLMMNWFVCSVNARLFIGTVSIVFHDVLMMVASSLMSWMFGRKAQIVFAMSLKGLTCGQWKFRKGKTGELVWAKVVFAWELVVCLWLVSGLAFVSAKVLLFFPLASFRCLSWSWRVRVLHNLLYVCMCVLRKLPNANPELYCDLRFILHVVLALWSVMLCLLYKTILMFCYCHAPYLSWFSVWLLDL